MSKKFYDYRDARGRSVKLLDPVAMHLMRPIQTMIYNHPTTIPSVPLREIAEKLDSAWTRRGYAIVLTYVVGLLVCYAGSYYYRHFISTNPTLDFVGMLFYAIQFVFMFGVLFATWHMAKRKRYPRICQIMLEYLRCPKCGYDLRGLHVDDFDQTTVCPECGCAWLLGIQR